MKQMSLMICSENEMQKRDNDLDQKWIKNCRKDIRYILGCRFKQLNKSIVIQLNSIDKIKRQPVTIIKL